MAYAATVTYSPSLVAGRRHLLVTVAETEGAATSEYSLALGERFPGRCWRLSRVKVTKTSGTAATFAPVWGEATDPTATTIAYLGGLAAETFQDSTNSGLGWVGRGSTLYARTVPNAGTDNVVTTRYYLIEGWGE